MEDRGFELVDRPVDRSVDRSAGRSGAGRYELLLDGEVVSVADYHPGPDADGGGDVVVIPHVETAPARRGEGHAARLMAGIVEDCRARGRRIVPVCWFAAAYLDARPQDQDVRQL